MNAFQILNSDGKAITMKQLDEEAASFWNKTVNNKYYASPNKPEEGETEESFSFIKRELTDNWYDHIGFCIANMTTDMSGWAGVIFTMLYYGITSSFIKKDDTGKVSVTYFEEIDKNKIDLPQSTQKSIYWTLDLYKPYIELIQHWQEKNYKPVKIE